MDVVVLAVPCELYHPLSPDGARASMGPVTAWSRTAADTEI